MNLYILPPHRNRPKTVRASYNIAELKNPSHLEEFQCLLNEKLPDCPIPSEDSIEKWFTFKKTITATFWELTPVYIKDWFDKSKSRQALDVRNKVFTE